MNYAEDRLDRRARRLELIYSPLDEKDWNKNSLSEDLNRAHSLIHEALQHSSKNEAIKLSKTGHELAGRTLRDCGLCAHASFHYAMAWICDVSDADRAGDYAQMAEFCGRPEVGIYSLLFYRSGGFFTTNILNYSTSLLAGNGTGHCGCNMGACGQVEFYIPCEMQFSNTYQKVIQTFHDLADVRNRAISPSRTRSAAEILEIIAASKNKDRNVKWKGYGICDLTDQLLRHDRFNMIRFWETISSRSDTNSDDRYRHFDMLDREKELSDGSPFSRTLSPLIQLLLLKLLYVSPMGGPYLYLACEAVPHLTINLTLSSDLPLLMAERYKSHWAYFVFIQYVVLGQRMKKHRRNKTPYHIPTWDIVHRLESHSSSGDIALNLCHIQHRHLDHPTLYVGDPFVSKKLRPVFAIGDSHVISIGWQTIKCKDELRLIVPLPVTGLKAWHCRDGTKFFTHYNLHQSLQRLPSSCKTIFVSAGEIDCREGIGGDRLKGFEDDCTEEIHRTVHEYVLALGSISKKYKLQILVMPVAPHARRSDKNGRKIGRAMRRERMMVWNGALRKECKAAFLNGDTLFLLDYEEKLRYPDTASPVGFVLNPLYNADYTHMNNSFLPLLEGALTSCGCTMELL